MKRSACQEGRCRLAVRYRFQSVYLYFLGGIVPPEDALEPRILFVKIYLPIHFHDVGCGHFVVASEIQQQVK